MKMRRKQQRPDTRRIRSCLIRLVLSAGVGSGLLVNPAAATQEAGTSVQLPPVFSALEGVWEGTGVLLDRPAGFRMEWRSGPGGFVRLSFDNAWMDDAGNRTPVLHSEATYLVHGASITGVWIDSRPQTIRLTAIATDSSLITTWTADQERGRTEYVVRSQTEVLVRDLVESGGGFHLFAEAKYTRQVSPAGPRGNSPKSRVP